MHPAKLRFVNAKSDPWAAKLFLALCFITLFSAYDKSESFIRLTSLAKIELHAMPHLQRAILPPVKLEIIPPEYTGLPTKLIEGAGRTKDIIAIASGSKIRLNIHSRWIAPKLYVSGQEYELTTSTNDTENQHFYSFEHHFNDSNKAPIDTKNTIAIKRLFLPLFSVKYKITPDTPPKLNIDTAPTAKMNGGLEFNAHINDDYGASKITILMDLPVDYQGELPLGQTYFEERAFYTDKGEITDVKIPLNLAHHNYAGMDVMVSFNVIDGSGQLSNTVSLPIKLPERKFEQETAQRIIALRKFIITEKLKYLNHIYKSLNELSRAPSVFNYDNVTIMGLSIARERILRDPNIASLYVLTDLFWRIALRLDNGEFLQAQQDLQQAINDLNTLLNNPEASEDQIMAAMNKLNNALAKYFQEAQKEVIRRMNNDEMALIPQDIMPNPGNAALRDFLSQMSDMALKDPKKAQELLQDLESALNNLNNNMQAQLPQDIQQMMAFMKQMDAIIEAQRALLDKSRIHQDYLEHLEKYEQRNGYSAQQKPRDREELSSGQDGESQPQNEPDSDFMGLLNIPEPEIHQNKGQLKPEKFSTEQNPASSMDPIAESATQRRIIGDLNEVTGNMPVMPDELKTAEKHMGNSAAFLEYERLKSSIPEQEKALDALSKKRDQMQQSFEQRLQQFAKENNIQFSFDPLGRSRGDNGLQRGLTKEYDVPKNQQKRYIDEILRDLRERAGDLERPKIEREYYKRLLHQW